MADDHTCKAACIIGTQRTALRHPREAKPIVTKLFHENDIIRDTKFGNYYRVLWSDELHILLTQATNDPQQIPNMHTNLGVFEHHPHPSDIAAGYGWEKVGIYDEHPAKDSGSHVVMVR